jgi:hypothetical protein
MVQSSGNAIESYGNSRLGRGKSRFLNWKIIILVFLLFLVNIVKTASKNMRIGFLVDADKNFES